MKLVTYANAEHGARAGIAVDAGIVDLQAGARDIGQQAPEGVVELLQLGDAGLAIAREVEAAANAGQIDVQPADDLRLLAAIPEPTTIYLLAGNYQSHITEGGAAPVDKARITPRPFRSLAPETAAGISSEWKSGRSITSSSMRRGMRSNGAFDPLSRSYISRANFGRRPTSTSTTSSFAR